MYKSRRRRARRRAKGAARLLPPGCWLRIRSKVHNCSDINNAQAMDMMPGHKGLRGFVESSWLHGDGLEKARERLELTLSLLADGVVTPPKGGANQRERPLLLHRSRRMAVLTCCRKRTGKYGAREDCSACVVVLLRGCSTASFHVEDCSGEVPNVKIASLAAQAWKLSSWRISARPSRRIRCPRAAAASSCRPSDGGAHKVWERQQGRLFAACSCAVQGLQPCC